jgi:sugar phosphate isomerase/epimerase
MNMRYGFCSYSFHRLLAAGKQDIHRLIRDCKTLGAATVDPWNSHLAPILKGDQALKAAKKPELGKLVTADFDYLKTVKDTAAEEGLPFGIIACDGGHIYEAEEGARALNRAVAYRWIDVAGFLGAKQVRVDSGGTLKMTDEQLKVIIAGYQDVIGYAKDRGVQIVVENHWGPTNCPDNVIRILESVEGLGFLFDSNNWLSHRREEAWERTAHLAKALHIKTFAFNDDGMDPTMNVERAIKLLQKTGYNGVWGIESCPHDGNEYAAARKTISLIERVLSWSLES